MRPAIASWLVVGAMAGAAAVPAPASAEVVVLESTVAALKKGASLADDATIKVPDGRRVRLLLPNGTTRRISGPYEGPADGARASTTSALPSMKRSFQSTIDGGASSKGVGAFQKKVTPQPAGPPVFTPPKGPVMTPTPMTIPTPMRK